MPFDVHDQTFEQASRQQISRRRLAHLFGPQKRELASQRLDQTSGFLQPLVARPIRDLGPWNYDPGRFGRLFKINRFLLQTI